MYEGKIRSADARRQPHRMGIMEQEELPCSEKLLTNMLEVYVIHCWYDGSIE